MILFFIVLNLTFSYSQSKINKKLSKANLHNALFIDVSSNLSHIRKDILIVVDITVIFDYDQSKRIIKIYKSGTSEISILAESDQNVIYDDNKHDKFFAYTHEIESVSVTPFSEEAVEELYKSYAECNSTFKINEKTTLDRK